MSQQVAQLFDSYMMMMTPLLVALSGTHYV
jgi:hypothetical protein